MLSHRHSPIKYGFDPTKPPPLRDGGTFAPSFDNRLWMFRRCWEPPQEVPVKATLMILHGTVDHSGVYDELAKRLLDVGIAVFAMDMRGWGLSDGESMYFNDVGTFVADVDALYHDIHSQPRYLRVRSRFLLGKSLGGLIAAFCVAKHPTYFTGLVGLSGAFEPDPNLLPCPIFQTLLRLLNEINPKVPLRQAFDQAWIVSDANAFQQWFDDPLCSKDKIRVGYIVELLRCWEVLRENMQFDIPMLMMIGTSDNVVAMSGHELMMQKNLHEDKTFKTYQGGYHNLLQEPALKEGVITDIQEWILSRAGGR